jgi:protein-disulfide isomerase
MQVGKVIPGFVLLTVLGAQPGAAQSSDELKALRKDVEELKAGQKAIQKELEGIKALVRAQQIAPQRSHEVTLSVEGAPFLGEKNAPLTLVEFTDFQCPYCARHFAQTMPQIVAEYVKTGKVKYVVRNFPLESLHPRAFQAAEAARCASEQKKYWEMHQRLMSSQNALDAKSLPVHAQALGLDLTAFQQCLDGGKEAAKVREDIADGEKAGVEGTPAFFLGITQPNEPTIKVTRTVGGALPYPSFKRVIDSLLAAQVPAPSNSQRPAGPPH